MQCGLGTGLSQWLLSESNCLFFQLCFSLDSAVFLSRAHLTIGPLWELPQLQKSVSLKVTSASKSSLYPRTDQHKGIKA